MSAHASQAFSIAHCTDSEDLPSSAWLLAAEHSGLIKKTLKSSLVKLKAIAITTINDNDNNNDDD